MLKTSLRIALLAAALGLTACSDSDVQTHGAGIQASDKTTLQDVGLPGYAGATPEKPMDGKEGNGGSFGAWAGKFGLQIHAMSFTSTASPVFTGSGASLKGLVIVASLPAFSASSESFQSAPLMA